jgi:hypothetical protein
VQQIQGVLLTNLPANIVISDTESVRTPAGNSDPAVFAFVAVGEDAALAPEATVAKLEDETGDLDGMSSTQLIREVGPPDIIDELWLDSVKVLIPADIGEPVVHLANEDIPDEADNKNAG